MLNTQPRPHAFDFRTAGFHFRNDGAISHGSLAFELPGTNLAATPHPERNTHVVHMAVLALVKDASGQVVDQYSIDAPYEIPDANLAAVRSSAIMYTHPLSLAPGRYTVDAVVLDREGRRASADTVEFNTAAPEKGVGLSSVLLLQRIEPVQGQPDPSDPLIFKGQRLVPYLSMNVTPDAKPFVYFVVYPDLEARRQAKNPRRVPGGRTDTREPDGRSSGARRQRRNPHDCEGRRAHRQVRTSDHRASGRYFVRRRGRVCRRSEVVLRP